MQIHGEKYMPTASSNYANVSYDQYFKADEYAEFHSDFQMEFISLWKGWLGLANLHKLDEVKVTEWDRFNELTVLLYEEYELLVANPDERTLRRVVELSEIVQSYETHRNKGPGEFTKLIIPELDCAITEEWDYTYIIWYKDFAAAEALVPLIHKVNLHHFGPT